MEEYDVLGNFKDLKSIFKNIPNASLATSALKDSPGSVLEESLDDSDILVDFATNIPKKETKPNSKSGKADKKQLASNKDPELKKQEPRKRRTCNKDSDFALKEPPKKSDAAEKEVAHSNSTIQNEGVAFRTRRSLRGSSVENQYERQIETVSSSLNSGRAEPSTTSTTITTARELESFVANSRGRSRKRANNSTRGRRNMANNSQTVLETISVENAGNVMRARRAARGSTVSGVTRSRRNMANNAQIVLDAFTVEDAASRAARCPTVGVIDLVTSPLPPMPTGVIDLEAEEEAPKSSATTISTTKQLALKLSLDEDNPEMSIKINWQFKLQYFKLRKYQKFATIFKQLAERENIELDQVFLNLNNQIIKPDDTPASISYKIYEFIEGRAMSMNNFGGTGAIPKKKRDPNIIKLKVQSDKFKKPLNIELNKTENFRKLVIKCAEELQIPYENIIKLCFDGETLDYQQTPLDLELEGGEIIEIHLKG